MLFCCQLALVVDEMEIASPFHPVGLYSGVVPETDLFLVGSARD